MASERGQGHSLWTLSPQQWWSRSLEQYSVCRPHAIATYSLLFTNWCRVICASAVITFRLLRLWRSWAFSRLTLCVSRIKVIIMGKRDFFIMNSDCVQQVSGSVMRILLLILMAESCLMRQVVFFVRERVALFLFLASLRLSGLLLARRRWFFWVCAFWCSVLHDRACVWLILRQYLLYIQLAF